MRKSVYLCAKRGLVIYFILALLLSGCDSTPPTTPQVPVSPATTVPLPTQTPVPTPDVATPESVGRSFLNAWEAADYAAMYALLLPSLRSGLLQADFEKTYRDALDTTTTLSVTLVPQTLTIDQDKAWITFTEIWHTGLFGDLQANNQLSLAKEGTQWGIDWHRDTVWPDLVGGNTFAVEYQIPPRANIYDRDGAGLAVPSSIVTVGVIPEQIQDEGAVLNALSQVLGLPVEKIQATYAGQPTNWYIPIADITGEESLTHNDLLSLPGIQRRERTGRLYPLDGVASTVVGWVSPIPAEAYDTYRQRGYRGDELVGIAGLEAWGEAVLAGRNGGRLSIVSADGTRLKAITERRPERGRAIYTTLDRALQYSAEQALGERRGAIVALDIRTGAVLAMVSGPHFDNNVFIRLTDTWSRQLVLNNPDLPLLNRAVQGLYPTGSVFKIVTMAAALEAGGMTAQSSFYCPGYWDGLGEVNRKKCWLETGHGTITLKDGLSASCNVTFYEVGKTLDGISPETLPTYGRAFGFGAKTGLQELTEAAGLMPDPEWKMTTYHVNWGTGDTVNLAIGQGYLLATPLQVARMMAAIANGGTLYRPYIVDRFVDSAGNTEQIALVQATGRLPISTANLTTIQQALYGVTTASFGTATRRFLGLGIPVAGKTGTAEAANKDDLPHAWFAGYFPADNPQIAMVVVVENAGEGSTVAAPMFRQVIEGYYGLPITPLPTPATAPEGD
ncbi:MAG TPA: penicillin-binding protein 2 [Anaerolineae bacterium]|nr:penicillin-binding protein 2 [Anaerolineae bacterium]HQK14665.1 penicillin-binding protein 2 [Anaerolineae bacterium]